VVWQRGSRRPAPTIYHEASCHQAGVVVVWPTRFPSASIQIGALRSLRISDTQTSRRAFSGGHVRAWQPYLGA